MIIPGGSTERQWHVWEPHLFQEGEACWWLMRPHASPGVWASALSLPPTRPIQGGRCLLGTRLLNALSGVLCPWEPGCPAAPHLPFHRRIFLFWGFASLLVNPALYRQFFWWTRNNIYGLKIPSWEVLLCFEYILTPWGNIHRDMGIKSNSRDIPSITVTPGRLHLSTTLYGKYPVFTDHQERDLGQCWLPSTLSWDCAQAGKHPMLDCLSPTNSELYILNQMSQRSLINGHTV